MVVVVAVSVTVVMVKWAAVAVVVLHQKTRRTRKAMKMKKMSRLIVASFHRLAQTWVIASPSMVVESVKNLPLMSVPPVEDRLFANIAFLCSGAVGTVPRPTYREPATSAWPIKNASARMS